MVGIYEVHKRKGSDWGKVVRGVSAEPVVAGDVVLELDLELVKLVVLWSIKVLAEFDDEVIGMCPIWGIMYPSFELRCTSKDISKECDGFLFDMTVAVVAAWAWTGRGWVRRLGNADCSDGRQVVEHFGCLMSDEGLCEAD